MSNNNKKNSEDAHIVAELGSFLFGEEDSSPADNTQKKAKKQQEESGPSVPKFVSLIARGQGDLKTKYRPRRLDELVPTCSLPQLKNIIDKPTSQIYLFEGKTGTGKTTCARIIGRASVCKAKTTDEKPCLECSYCHEFDQINSYDVTEMNVADKRKIEDMRKLIEEFRYKPAILPKKIYILDEVQQLTPDAQQLLLTELENPPPYILIFLCTTDIQDLNKALVDRASRITFSDIKPYDARLVIDCVLAAEGKEADNDTKDSFYIKSRGSVRALLNNIQSFLEGGYSPDIFPEDEASAEVKNLAKAVLEADWSTLSALLKRPNVRKNPEELRLGLESYLRTVLLSKQNLSEASALGNQILRLSEPLRENHVSNYNKFVLQCLRACNISKGG